MASAGEGFKWVRISPSSIALAIAAAAISVTTTLLSASALRWRSRRLASRVRELESSLAAALEKGAAERRGRVRAQQALRKALAEQSYDGSSVASPSPSPPLSSYPMVPIGTVQSCFSTRNGTPRQPLLVPLARACLVFDQARVPPGALEGLADYSHCWIIYVFHLNTDLEKLWKEPSRSKFKAKVRVPRLKGGKMGVLATRSPHRPCPIGLTVAKVEALDGHAVLLSGVDLVDGTPVLDIKPYLPYSDCIQGARIPLWLKAENALAVTSVSFSVDFRSSLSSCWTSAEKHSLYTSMDEFQTLIKEVLSWDIRSLSQQSRPHHVTTDKENHEGIDILVELKDGKDATSIQAFSEVSSSSPNSTVIYHLILEGVDISYRIDNSSNIIVEKATVTSDVNSSRRELYNHLTWRKKFQHIK